MRPVLIPLILTTLVSFALANPDYEEDVFSVEEEGEYPDEDPDNRMGIMGMAKSGQNLGANVTCMRWTSRLVTVAAATESHLSSTESMRRCTVQYKLAADCNEMMFSCDSFYIPNNDAYKCTKGSAFHTKADSTPVRDFCKRQGPDINFPVLAMSGLKVWYVNDKGFEGKFSCVVSFKIYNPSKLKFPLFRPFAVNLSRELSSSETLS